MSDPTHEGNDIDRTLGRGSFWRSLVFAVMGLLAISLYPLSQTNYLLFHTLIELSGIAVSITLFSIGWNSRHITRNDGFALLAISFLVVAVLDLLHTLAYKGMGVFPNAGIDLPTQFWIAARLTQAFSYLLASYLFSRMGCIKHWRTLVLYLVFGILLILSIWPWRLFPSCINETSGLTLFKVGSEYLVCIVLAASGWILWRKKHQLNSKLLQLFLLSIGSNILSEIAFTLYQDVYGISNVLGHFLKLASVVFVYRAFVYGSLRTPYQFMFHELHKSHEALDQELTIRRKTEEQLRNINQDLDAFVRTASHDLRSPLTTIITGTELLQTELKEKLSDKQCDLIEIVHKQGHRMSRLLNDLLSLARVGSVSQPLEVIDPTLIAAQAIEDLSKEIMTNQCKVHVEEMPEIKAHSSLFYQILLNLIANAVRYGSNPEKAIEIGAKIQGDIYRLFVKDYGPGIPVEERDKIFDVFYRSDNDQPQGTGVGLAIVQKIARYYSGTVYVEETPGGGSTFIVEVALNRTEDDR